MLNVGREFFVPQSLSALAHADRPLPLGYGATISAPHMHAMALELLKDSLVPGANVLDVGSGSGYMLACMAEMVRPGGRVYGIDHITELVSASKINLSRWQIANKHSRPPGESVDLIEVLVGDGYAGLAGEHNPCCARLKTIVIESLLADFAPFNAIHVGAAAPEVPSALTKQLLTGGRLVIPVGLADDSQDLLLVKKDHSGELTHESCCRVRSVRVVSNRGPGVQPSMFDHSFYCTGLSH